LPEKKHAGNEQEGINNTGENYPPEKPVLLNKKPGFFPALYSDDNFFEQCLKLRSKYSEW
jgi:hypothetical protein